jgi:hypothetical protein
VLGVKRRSIGTTTWREYYSTSRAGQLDIAFETLAMRLLANNNERSNFALCNPQLEDITQFATYIDGHEPALQ